MVMTAFCLFGRIIDQLSLQLIVFGAKAGDGLAHVMAVEATERPLDGRVP